MDPLTVIATLMALSSLIAVTAGADDKAPIRKGVDGSWEGRVIVTPQISLRITLDVAKGKDGSLSGKP
jgi:hypothetical protein